MQTLYRIVSYDNYFKLSSSSSFNVVNFSFCVFSLTLILITEAMLRCLLLFLLCFIFSAGACQASAKYTMRLCHIGILLTRVKPVLTPGVLLGNCVKSVIQYYIYGCEVSVVFIADQN